MCVYSLSSKQTGYITIIQHRYRYNIPTKYCVYIGIGECRKLKIRTKKKCKGTRELVREEKKEEHDRKRAVVRDWQIHYLWFQFIVIDKL